ncbi:MAG: pilin [Minisyncoccales bacterium]
MQKKAIIMGFVMGVFVLLFLPNSFLLKAETPFPGGCSSFPQKGSDGMCSGMGGGLNIDNLCRGSINDCNDKEYDVCCKLPDGRYVHYHTSCKTTNNSTLGSICGCNENDAWYEVCSIGCSGNLCASTSGSDDGDDDGGSGSGGSGSGGGGSGSGGSGGGGSGGSGVSYTKVECKPEQQGGLVPCGRRCDDPDTTINEQAPCTFCHFLVLFKRIIDFLTTIIAFPVLALMIIAGGIMFLTSSGNEKQLNKAKEILKTAVIGVVIILCAWLVIDTIITILTPGDSPLQSWNEINCPFCGDGSCESPENSRNCPYDCY